jgi:hypothetical protein
MISNRDLKRDLSELNHRLDMIQTVLLVSNPDSPVAADAYEGLRRTVIQSLSATKALYAAIAQLDAVAASTDEVDAVRVKLNELMTQYGIRRIDRYEDRPDAFERIGSGPSYVATKPAYVASAETPPVMMGVAESAEEPGHTNEIQDPTTTATADDPDRPTAAGSGAEPTTNGGEQ